MEQVNDTLKITFHKYPVEAFRLILHSLENRDAGHCLMIIVGRDAHIMDVLVPHVHRGKGYCKKLLEDAVKSAYLDNDCVRVILHTSQIAMQRCAAAAGFKSTGEEMHMEKAHYEA